MAPAFSASLLINYEDSIIKLDKIGFLASDFADMAPPSVLLLLKNRDDITENPSQLLQSTAQVLWAEVPLNILTSYS